MTQFSIDREGSSVEWRLQALRLFLVALWMCTCTAGLTALLWFGL